MEESASLTIEERLWLLPKQILQKELEVLELIDSLEGFKVKFAMLELEIYDVVESMIDNEGKKVFSNKEKRDIETQKRIKTIPDTVDLQNKIKELDKKIKVSKIELDYMGRQFRSAEALSRLNG
jgi:hypothetical protein